MDIKPFLLRPTGKDYLWGGNRLNDDFQKKINMSPLAETWECSTHPDGPSYIVGGVFDGMELAQVLREHPEYIGSHPETVDELPILIKFIDAKKDLSVQVHPSDEYALKNENGQLGKTEMWYVLDALPDAKLVYGLRKDATKEQIMSAVISGNLMPFLRQVPVKKGDLFFIPAGTIHAIGKGVLVAEIQENSNLTYRLYDYDRVGKDGKKRELHVEKALAVSCLEKTNKPLKQRKIIQYSPGKFSQLLCRCKYFEVHKVIINTENQQKVSFVADSLSFRVLLCVDGCGSFKFKDETIDFFKGDCLFLPANSQKVFVHGKAELLEVNC